MAAPRNAVLAAIEDDKLILATAEYVWNGTQFDVPVLRETKAIARPLPALPDDASDETRLDDNADIADEKLIEALYDYGQSLGGHIDAYGISTPGAVISTAGLVRTSQSRGAIKGTNSINFKATLQSLKMPARTLVYLENDASAAALGEAIWGSGSGASEFAYIWVGRGINLGVVANGSLLRGRLHPEAGHMRVARHPDDMAIPGTCVTHGDCLLGLCSYVSLLERERMWGSNDAARIKIQGIVSHYLAQLCVNTALFVAPARIAIGGMSMRSNDLLRGILPDVRANFDELLQDYPRYIETIDLETFIVSADLGEEVALLGMAEIVRRNLTAHVRGN